ncbi:hypothetical protein F5141DRAFT_1067853 [Pisolithus sp. B1]|nr:hypothetical protein F5141DRAFT_1067853 [Pisolithus sp. B1]
MAPQTCSQLRSLKTRITPSPSDHDLNPSSSSPLSPSFDLLMNALPSPSRSVPEDQDSSFDEAELDFIYQKCQAMMEHLAVDHSESNEEHQPLSQDSDDFSADTPEPNSPRSLPSPPPPALSDVPHAPSVHHVIMCSMARPTMWAIAYQNLGTLKYQTWIDATILNFHLLSRWYAVQGRTHVRYVDLFSAIPSISSGTHVSPEAEETSLFQQRHLFHSLPADPSSPVAFVVMHASHFFVIVFDYECGSAFVLGRRISNVPETPHPYYDELHDDWNRWNGPFYWSRIAALHGYNSTDPGNVDVMVHNWTQNGYDCGPIASFVMESLMASGLYGASNTIQIPPIPCGHHLRLQMLETVKEACRRSWEDYRYLSTTILPPGNVWLQWDDTEALGEDVITDVENEVMGVQDASIICELNVVSANCPVCNRIDAGVEELSPIHSDDDLPNEDEDIPEGHQPPLLDSRAQRLRDLLRCYPYVSKARARDSRAPHAVHGRYLGGKSAAEDPLEVIRTRKHVKDWSAGSMFRFPCPTPAVYLPAYQGHWWKPFNRRYDDYECGPVLESLHQDQNCYEIVEEPYHRPGIWTSFRDYGYHLLSSFSQMFYLDPPVRLADHILPVGIPDGYDTSHQIGDYSLGRIPLPCSSSTSRILVEDVVILSASDMIQMSTADSSMLVNTFVRGKHEDGHHICLNLELDRVPLTLEHLEVTVDIDSLIWVTCDLRFHTPLAVYLGPILEEKALMQKNNHVYVDILIPQSVEDAKGIGGRTEWLTMSFPLCGIPHTPFGTLSNASGNMSIYICFPRMIHRDKMTHRRASRMPKEVLDYFWEHVLLPAISKHADVGSAPYVSLTLDEVQFKARKGTKKRPGRPKAVPFSMDVLKKINYTMREIIQRDPLRYANYGSFFFVVDCKGIKLWAKAHLFQDDSSPIDTLLNGIPALDWPHMVDRNNGELLVDLGIGIHPKWDEKLVGLWRLDCLEASFGAGGYLQGSIHHTCTLGRYGAMQAEISQERVRQTHVAFRSAYSLAYEAIRPNDNLPTFVMDKDAYALNSDFMQECMEAINMYSGEAKQRSYGVRDEYRMGGMAMEKVMDDLAHRVWFEFQARRVRALQTVQISLKELDPPNLGILTGIVCHMIRCTSSTPIILDYHVRESMALLQFSRICERFGLFFLCDLDLQKAQHLKEVQQHDDLEVLKLMQAKLKKPDGRPAWPRITLDGDEEQFPIGNMPTWSRLTKTIRDQPWLVMRSWTWSRQLSYLEPVVGKLFVQFTCQLWIQMDNAWLMDPEKRPEPTSLEDAPCNAEVPGSTVTGRWQPNFSDRMSMFFPEVMREKPAWRSPWNVFWTKPGYISEYHDLMKDRTISEQFKVTNHLEKIFSLLQTLPDSTKGSAKTPGKTWRVEDERVVLVTNPKFYRLEGISKEGEQRPARRKVSRAVKSRNRVHMDLMEHAGYGELLNSKALLLERRRLEQARNRKSAKVKNARKPPARQGEP